MGGNFYVQQNFLSTNCCGSSHICIFADYESAGCSADAKSDVEKYAAQIKANPNDANAYYNRGNIYYDLNNYNQAISDYTKAIELNPNDTGAYNNRGIAYETLGDSSRVDSDFKKSTELGFKG